MFVRSCELAPLPLSPTPQYSVPSGPNPKAPPWWFTAEDWPDCSRTTSVPAVLPTIVSRDSWLRLAELTYET